MYILSETRPHSPRRAGLRPLLRWWLALIAVSVISFCPTSAAAENPADAGAVAVPAAAKAPVESELISEGLVSYGNYRIFASGRGFELFTSGLEYDRHSWGYFLRARMDYVAEVLPFVLLKAPTVTAPWGQPLTADRKLVPGVGVSPIGFRMLWRDGRVIKPYLSAKGGMIAFKDKEPAAEGTYENFSLQSTGGVLVKLNQRMDLRLGLFGDFHFSNAFMVPNNAGLDVMNANFGLSYHLANDRH